MSSGTFQHLLSILRETETDDDMGGTVKAWEIVGSLWASLSEPSGRELMAPQITESLSTVVRTHYRTDLSVKDRLQTQDGRVLHILTIDDPTGRMIETRMRCAELQG
jgi:SPP1 family predicted phage head-tail adaptor